MNLKTTQDPESSESPSRRSCENCGLPRWAVAGDGLSVVVQHKPENAYQRTKRRTVWCHSEECAIQALAISRYGLNSNRWPVTLAQFRSTNPLNQLPAHSTKRTRASKRAKEMVWTANLAPKSRLESRA
jgi:hypothetical protein